MLPARIRLGVSWSDACILNISSRGLLIQSGRPAPEGSVVELRRGDHAIHARVVWSDGAKAGLRADNRVPVEDLRLLGQSAGLHLNPPPTDARERRKRPRGIVHDSRMRARAMEFACVGLIAASLSAGALAMVEKAMAAPLAAVDQALKR